jgi:hypothetical protein
MASFSQISSDWSSANKFNSTMAGNKYFYAESRALNIFGLESTPYIVLRPSGDGLVNVCDDMNWCNPGGDRSEVPRIFVTEKELQYGAWATQLSNLLYGTAQAAVAGTVDSFVQLYAAENTGFTYNFPWLLKTGDNIRTVSNTWAAFEGLGSALKSSGTGGSSFGGGLDNLALAAKLIGTGAGIVGAFATPGFGFEETKQYGSTEPQSVTISFPLYNTIDLESAFSHFSFVNLFTFQSLKTRTSLMSFIPPKIYEVDAGSIGGLYMAAAVVTNFKVDSIGTTRRMREWSAYGTGEILIPEAYKVTITFTDLLSQSSNVFAGAMGGSKISITNANTAEVVANLNQGLNNVTGFIGNLPNAAQQLSEQAGWNAAGLFYPDTVTAPAGQDTPTRGGGQAPIAPVTPNDNFLPPSPPPSNNPSALPPSPPSSNNPSALPPSPPPAPSTFGSASFRSNIPARFVPSSQPQPMRL